MASMSAICITYRAQVIDGKLRKSIEGRPYWISKEDLLEKLSDTYRTMFQDYLQSCK